MSYFILGIGIGLGVAVIIAVAYIAAGTRHMDIDAGEGFGGEYDGAAL